MYDIVTLGELLIDFIPDGGHRPAFTRNPGGAPANLLAAAAKLGANTALIGCVGEDSFGHFLISAVAEQGICTDHIRRHPTVPTTLAFVHLDAMGERSFSFYRNPGADVMLTEEDVPPSLLQSCRVFHFGSLSLTHEPARTATRFAVEQAGKSGALISFDPNYRPPLWPSAEAAKEQILSLLPFAHILKVSEEELELLTGTADPAEGSAQLSALGPSLVFITLGEKGAFCRWKDSCISVTAPKVEAVDTTGCGDGFFGAVLSRLCRVRLDTLTVDALEEITAFGCAAGSIVAARPGALASMPTREEIESMLK